MSACTRGRSRADRAGDHHVDDPSRLSAEFAAGTSLFQAIVEASGKFASKCGACHAFVTEGREGLSKKTAVEYARLDSIVGVGSKSRLACQASLLGTEAVTVELLGALSG